jgi:hypothetical protein
VARAERDRLLVDEVEQEDDVDVREPVEPGDDVGTEAMVDSTSPQPSSMASARPPTTVPIASTR